MTFAFLITLNSALKILRKHYVTDRQLERLKMKHNISLQKTIFRRGCFPIWQCLPPSLDEHIFSIIGVHVLTTIQFCFYMFIFQISIQYSISYFFCKTLDIPRVLRTLIYFKTVNIIIKNLKSFYKIP